MRVIIPLFGLLLATALPAAADSGCAAAPLAALPLRMEQSRVLVEIAINDRPAWFALDTGAAQSVISTGLVQRLGLHTMVLRPIGASDIGGRHIDKVTYKVAFTLGGRRTSGVFRKYMVADLGVDGLLGSDLLGSFDVDLDFAGERMNLFARGACRGEPPGSGPYQTISMAVIGAADRVRAPVTLDGRDYWAIIDTGTSRSYIAASQALADFGIRMEDSATRKVRGVYGGELNVVPHDFGTLKIGDVVLPKPRLNLTTPEKGFGESQILLGLEHLRNLRLFIAFGKRRLTIAPARPS